MQVFSALSLTDIEKLRSWRYITKSGFETLEQVILWFFFLEHVDILFFLFFVILMFLDPVFVGLQF